MIVYIRFLGSLKHDLFQETLSYQVSFGSTIREIVFGLIDDPKYSELKLYFSESFEKKRSLLIFINDQEISALDGMATKVKENDNISFVPVVHGG
ncbi:MAG: MoaD/ThiS family protein [Candidatus Hodarchaeales archaeon]